MGKINFADVMRVLMFNTYDLRGGAARATWRLFNGLRELGHDATLAVQENISGDRNVLRISSPVSGMLNPLRPYIDFAIPFLQTRKRVLFSSSLLPDRIHKVIDNVKPDVVHLNWITGGFIRLETLAAIKCPVVWTLHDMWAFTGGCHYTGECRRYMGHCGQCPVLHSGRENDLSRRVFERKMRIYSAMPNLTITTPSQWLAGRVKESPLLHDKPVHVVPNGLNTAVYSPGDKAEMRRNLGLNDNRKLILFGAIRGVHNPQKGFNLLVEATRHLDPGEFELIVFGSSEKDNPGGIAIPSRFLGTITDEEKLVALYRAADVVAVPSVQEVFGQAATEALACGVPVAAFGATGLTDIVLHEKTGFLAKPFDPVDLATGIRWITGDKERLQQLSEAARERAIAVYSATAVAEKMATLYKEVLNGG